MQSIISKIDNNLLTDCCYRYGTICSSNSHALIHTFNELECTLHFALQCTVFTLHSSHPLQYLALCPEFYTYLRCICDAMQFSRMFLLQWRQEQYWRWILVDPVLEMCSNGYIIKLNGNVYECLLLNSSVASAFLSTCEPLSSI